MKSNNFLDDSISEISTDTKLDKKIIESSKQTTKKKTSQGTDNLFTPPEISGLEEDGYEKLEYLLIQEYFECLGLNLTPTSLRYESQHPDVKPDRRKLSQELNLKSYDKVPLLVQLISERLSMIEKEGK